MAVFGQEIGSMQMSYSLKPLTTPAGPLGKGIVPFATKKGIHQVEVDISGAEIAEPVEIVSHRESIRRLSRISLSKEDEEAQVVEGASINLSEECPERVASLHIFTLHQRKQRVDLSCFRADMLAYASAPKFFLRGRGILLKRFSYMSDLSDRILPTICALLIAFCCMAVLAFNSDSPSGQMFDADRIYNRYSPIKNLSLNFSYLT